MALVAAVAEMDPALVAAVAELALVVAVAEMALVAAVAELAVVAAVAVVDLFVAVAEMAIVHQVLHLPRFRECFDVLVIITALVCLVFPNVFVSHRYLRSSCQ